MSATRSPKVSERVAPKPADPQPPKKKRDEDDGPDFGTRIAALDPALDPDLVIVQGSINDRKLPADGYRARANGRVVAATVLRPGGPLAIPLDAGENVVELDYQAPLGVRAAGWLSSLTWLLGLAALAWPGRGRGLE